MKAARVDAISRALREAPVGFQGVNFDENPEKARQFAEWLIEYHGLLGTASLTYEECLRVYNDLRAPADRDTSADAAEVHGSLVRGRLLLLAHGDES